jgi:hypothetical protein
MEEFNSAPPGTYFIQSGSEARKLKLSLQAKIEAKIVEAKVELKPESVVLSKHDSPETKTKDRTPPILVPELVEIEGKNGEPSTWSYVFSCPGCLSSIQVLPNEINCKEFRCGDTLNPHATKEECTRAVSEGRIRGCGTAFQFDGIKAGLIAYKE